jgi:hypothetical protein
MKLIVKNAKIVLTKIIVFSTQNKFYPSMPFFRAQATCPAPCLLLSTHHFQWICSVEGNRPSGAGFVDLCPYGGSLHKNEPIIGGRSSEVSFLFQRFQAITITNIVIDDKFFDFITIYALRGKVFASYNPLESINNLLKSTLNYIWHSNGISNMG